MAQAFYAVVYWVSTTFGVSYATAYAITFAFVYSTALTLLNTAIKALNPRPKGGRGYGLEYNYAGTAEARRIVYGKQRLGGMQTIPPFVTGYDGSMLHMVLTIAGHPVNDITDVWFDTQLIADADIDAIQSNSNSGQVLSGTYAGFAWIRRYDGTQTSVDWLLNDTNSTYFPSTFVGHEITYMAVKLKYGDLFSTGIPNLTALVYGKKIYDPRLDSTNGGSGTHRYTDPNTWEYSVNPALVARDYLVNEVGFGNDEIDDTTVAAAANICDEQVEIPPGATYENRYECNLTLFANESWEENIKSIVDCMFGRAIYRDAQWRIFAGAWDTPSSGLTITKDDWVSPTVVKISVDREDRWNAVRASYVDPDRNWQYSEAYPRRNTTYESDDGGERIWREIELPGVISEYQAQRIAELSLRLSRNQVRISGRLRPEFVQLAPWDTITVTDDEYGWVAKTFRVLSMNLATDGSVEVALVEDGSALYTDLAVAEYEEVTTVPTMDPGATLPAVAGTLVATPQAGYIEFQWSESVDALRGQRYRLLESVNCYDPHVASVVWAGLATNAVVPRTDVTTRFYWVQARIGSYFSGFSPSSWGLGAAANSPPADGTPGTYAPNLQLQLDGYAFRYSGSGTSIGVNTVDVQANLTALPGVTANFYAQNYLIDGTALSSYELSGSGNSGRGLHVNSFTEGGSTAYAYVVASGGGFSDRQTVLRLQEGADGTDGAPGAPGSAGPANFTINSISGYEVGPNWFRKIADDGAYTEGPYSTERYGPTYLSFTVPTNPSSDRYLVGLTASHTTPNTPWGYLAYAFFQYPGSPNALFAMEFGQQSGQLGTTSSGDQLTLTYVGQTIQYWQNGVKLREVITSYSQAFWLDSTILSSGTQISNIGFGPLAQIEDGAAPFTINSMQYYAVGVNWINKVANNGAWGPGPYTSEGYPGGAYIQMRCDAGSRAAMFGLTQNPNDGYGYPTITHALYLGLNGQLQFYTGGSSDYSPPTSYAAGDVLAIQYDGRGSVTYLRNSEVLGTIVASDGLSSVPLYGKWDIYNTDQGFYDIGFGPMGRRGYDPITGLLTNDAYTLVASYNGYIPSYAGAIGEFQVFEGVNRVSTNSITFTTEVKSPSGMTAAITAAGSYSITAGIGTSDEYGAATFRAAYRGVNLDKVFTVGKAKGGATGYTGGMGPPGANILANGNMTYVDSATGLLSQWSLYSGQYSISDTGGIDGTRCMVINSYASGQRAAVHDELIPVDPMHEAIAISAQVRSVNSGQRVYFFVACYDETKKQIPPEQDHILGLLTPCGPVNSGDTSVEVWKLPHNKSEDSRHPGYHATTNYNYVSQCIEHPGTFWWYSWPMSTPLTLSSQITAINTTASTTSDLLTISPGMRMTQAASGTPLLHGETGATYRYIFGDSDSGTYKAVPSSWTTLRTTMRGFPPIDARLSYSRGADQYLAASRIATFRQRTKYIQVGMFTYGAGAPVISDVYVDNFYVARMPLLNQTAVDMDPEMICGGGVWGMDPGWGVTSYDHLGSAFFLKWVNSGPSGNGAFYVGYDASLFYQAGHTAKKHMFGDGRN